MHTLIIFLRLVTLVRNWPTYFLNKYGFIKDECRLTLRSGLVVSARPYAVDGSALNEVWLERSYDPTFFGVPFAWESASSIVDVGGHIGTFTLFAAQRSPNAKIITLEPDRDNFQLLEKNVEQNNLRSRVTLINAALGDGSPAQLHTFSEDRGGHSLYRLDSGGAAVTIQTVRLADLLRTHHLQHLDFLKLDCEGAEYDGLYAMSPQELSEIRCIAMEYHHFSKHPRHSPQALEEFLVSHGFRTMRHRKSMMLAWRI